MMNYESGEVANVYDYSSHSHTSCKVVRKLDTSVDGYDQLDYYLVMYETMYGYGGGRVVKEYDVVNSVNLRKV